MKHINESSSCNPSHLRDQIAKTTLCKSKQYIPPHLPPSQKIAALLKCVFTVPFYLFSNSFNTFMRISKQYTLYWFLSLIQVISCCTHFWGICFLKLISFLGFVHSFVTAV